MRKTLIILDMNIYQKLLIFVFSVLLLSSESAVAKILYGPPMVRWGMKPSQIQTIYARKFKYVGSYPKPDTPKVIYQQKYIGPWLNQTVGHISPVYYLGKLFTLSVYFPMTKEKRASQIWEETVGELTKIYGNPVKYTRPTSLTSSHTTTAQYPVDEGEKGRFQVLDLQIQTGIWVPNAEWRFTNGAYINALIHASEPDEKGMRVIMPLVVYNKHNILYWKN